MYRLCLTLIFSLYSLQIFAACTDVVDVNKVNIHIRTTQQLLGALNTLNPSTHLVISLEPGIYQFSEDQSFPDINSQVSLYSWAITGNTSGPVIFEGLDSEFRRGPVTFATVGECGALHLADIIFRGFSGQYDSILKPGSPASTEKAEEKAPFFWNKGDLKLDRVQFIDRPETGQAKARKNLVSVPPGGQILSNKKVSSDEFLSDMQIQTIGTPKYIKTYINPLILNEGKLLLSSVAASNFLSLSSHTLYNYGSAVIENSYFEEKSGISPVVIKTFSGELSINYTSFVYLGSSDPFASGGSTFLRTTNNKQIKISNSVFNKRLAARSFNFSSDALNCKGEGVISLGYNISDDDSCGFTAIGDLENTDPILKKIVNKDSELISVPYFGLTASSPAVDSASQTERCGSSARRDLFFPRRAFDGNGDGEIRCDRGWPELTQKALSNGGTNGVFYDPQSDGHYLTVVDNDANTLILWNTFNMAGEPQWIYAVGELKNGRSFVGDAYVNQGGRLEPGGTMQAAEAKLWGSLQVEFDTCDSATVNFQTNRDDFGNGEFKVQRLARVKQLGCTE